VKKKRSAIERWGNHPNLFSAGFLVVPVKFLTNYSVLGVSTNEAMFLLQLMTFKWDSAAPYPSYGRIARRMGISEKMARRYAKGLEQKGLLRRMFQNRAPNRFDLSALFQAVATTPGLHD
jgi:hypothetical protein